MIRLLVCWLLFTAPVEAATLTLTLPDDRMDAILQQVCQWYHCPEGGSAEERVQAVASLILNTVSMGHYPTLTSIQATLRATWDRDAASVQ